MFLFKKNADMPAPGKRIISDEGSGPPQPAAAPEAPPPTLKPAAPAPEMRKPAPRAEPDVLELTDVVEKAPGGLKKMEGHDVMFREPEPAPVLAPRPAAPMLNEELLSQHASSTISSAFGSLAHTMNPGDSRSIDDLVREMLKPMLKTWLEDNLPSLVERLVRAEIERVSRGSR